MTANQKISAMISYLVQQGLPVNEAVDAILGEGTFAQLASDVYHALRARAGI